MYETEANLVQISGTEIPREILARFAESRESITGRTLIPWGEHCTECAWPTCYTTCDLYSPRFDGRCRRFVEGMVRVDCPDLVNSHLLKISFKRWAKLWSAANLKLYPLSAADRKEKRDFQIAKWIGKTPLALRRTLIRKRYSMKKRWANRLVKVEPRPNCFMVECYNPASIAVSITVTIRREGARVPFHALLRMEPGFNRQRVVVADIEQTIDLSTPFHIELTPNEISEGTTLYFGVIDFVLDTTLEASGALRRETERARICKCVVWDLDNTVWDGTLIEDGPENVRLRPGIVEILRQLDEWGVLISAASKNNSEDALSALRRFGIEEYFLFPQISWQPKSESIQRIATSLNIGVDSLLFVDDSPFERAEVMSVLPEIMVLDALEYREILNRPDCRLTITAESRNRRLFYREQEQRQNAQKDHSGDYMVFLRNCNLRLTIRSLTWETLERVHELTQRTNQMNFSGNRYSRDQLQEFLRTSNIDTYVLDCEDRFGSYGTIGFCLMNRAEARMTDLMFSCRVQGKRVEHDFVSYLIRKYREAGAPALLVDYRKTKKNAGPGKVFDDLGFQLLGEANGVTRMAFSAGMPLSDDSVVTIVDRTAVLPVLAVKAI
jgi:FkbH-like protein